ncbi:MAG: hypothetical protein K8T25_14325 [Planctomycetia bacterium]|nr:hypothetical protein [Planctomycetia bacterium]
MATQKQNQQSLDDVGQVVTYHCDQCGHEIQVDAPRAEGHAPVCCGEEMRVVKHQPHQRHDQSSQSRPSMAQPSGARSDQTGMPYGKSQRAGKMTPGG